MRNFLTITLFFFSAALQAQELNRYVVYFTDKGNNSYSIDRPLEFLSSRALERREEQGLSISPEDLPVSPSYIEAVAEAGVTVFYQSRWFNAVLIEAEETDLAAIKALPMVEEIVFAAPVSNLQARQWTVTKKSAAQAALPETLQNSLLGIAQLQEAGYTGEGKLIAVFDGGFTATNTLDYFNHLFVEERLLATYDYTTATDDVFRYSAHGTKALSTIAAIDSAELIGTAPFASFMLAVTEEVATEYVVEEYNWLFAAEWADSVGADVISSSLGYTTFDDPSMNYTYSDMDGVSTVAGLAATIAARKGILVVSSAGNSGNDAWKYISTPADALNILAVGAITPKGEPANFSSYGPSADGRVKPDVAALGVETIVANEAGGFTKGNGTSFAAPQIAGFAAAVWQAYPELTNLELRELILQSGSHSFNPDERVGYGVPYFPKLQAVILSVPKPVEEHTWTLFPNPLPASQELYIKTADLGQQPLTVKIFTSSGTRLLHGSLLKVPTQSGTYKLLLPELPSGLYFLHIRNGADNSVHKLIKY